jgi:integrase/recombinase XerD
MNRSPRSHCLEVPDVHFGRGPFGKLHVRFGKGAHTSGPRPRWVPMLDGLDLVLRWFLTDVRPRFPDSPVLFADESGGALHRGTIRNRLRYLMQLEGRRRPSGSAHMPCGGRVRPTTTSEEWILLLFNSFWGTGR